MSERKWTPGPWAVKGDRGIRGANGECVASTYCAAPAEDAHLIAAAPDLYVALEAVLGRYTDLVASGDAGHWDCEDELEVKLARVTLAKARGEA